MIMRSFKECPGGLSNFYLAHSFLPIFVHRGQMKIGYVIAFAVAKGYGVTFRNDWSLPFSTSLLAAVMSGKG